ncbi:MAG: alpha/beta fold hydrolase [bacterium]|nr:alpha/beta fold hydrolase [bacterium]
METIYIPTFDGTFIFARLHLPHSEGPHPGLLYMTGNKGGKGARWKANNPLSSHHVAHFVSEGYAVLETDYRRFHFAEEELEDVIASYRYLKSRPEVDSKRVAVAGASHGGYLALMLATKERPAAILAYAALVDIVGIFYEQAQSWVPEFWGNPMEIERLYHDGHSIREESILAEQGNLVPHPREDVGVEVSKELAYRWGADINRYKAYSPMEQIHLIEAPLLYVAGGKDELRHEGKRLVDQLNAGGKDATYSEHPGAGHSFYTGKDERLEDGNLHPEYYRALEIATRFLNDRLNHPSVNNR